MKFTLSRNATDLSSVPSNTTELDCGQNDRLHSLKGLPASLKILDCSGCSGLSSLRGLPAGLETLTSRNCGGLTSIDGLPKALVFLDCSWCLKLKALVLPPALTDLHSHLCRELVLIHGPASLKILDVSNCANLHYLEPRLVLGVQTAYRYDPSIFRAKLRAAQFR